MKYTENTYSSIKAAYKKVGNIYSSFSFMPWLIIFICFYIMFIYCVKIEVNSSTNWNIDKCSSKYVFFSGFMKNEGNNAFDQTIKNFMDCIDPSYNTKINKMKK